jgi:hypothetical protein
MANLRCTPIARRSRDDLSYTVFLREYALPGVPVIITGFGDSWAARSHWSSLDGLMARGVDLTEEVQVQLGADGVATMPLGECIQKFQQRWGGAAVADPEASAARMRTGRGVKRPAAAALNADDESNGGPSQPSMYLRNWRFHERNPHLLGDFATPDFFDLDFAVELGLIQPDSFTWIYVGEQGSSTPTHIDIMNSSAWLYVTCGRKKWRMVSGGADLPRCFARQRSGPGCSEGGDSIGGSVRGRFPWYIDTPPRKIRSARI